MDLEQTPLEQDQEVPTINESFIDYIRMICSFILIKGYNTKIRQFQTLKTNISATSESDLTKHRATQLVQTLLDSLIQRGTPEHPDTQLLDNTLCRN